MPSKFCRHPRQAALQEPAVPQHHLDHKPDHSPDQPDRAEALNKIHRLIQAGMCVSARVMAENLGVQFNNDTLRNWTRDKRQNDLTRHRKTYAWLVKNTPVPVPAPTPVPVIPLPTPALITQMPRRPRFVRVPSKVA